MIKKYILVFIVVFFHLFAIYGQKNKVVKNDRQDKATEIIDFARTLLGAPYKYASQDPIIGFDCSGYVNYVYTHFEYKVPRISRLFADIGEDISIQNAEIGDIILFTGTDLNSSTIGHVGIITENTNGQIVFIHSSSGKNSGVIFSNLEGYYETRFVKIVRIIT